MAYYALIEQMIMASYGQRHPDALRNDHLKKLL